MPTVALGSEQSHIPLTPPVPVQADATPLGFLPPPSSILSVLLSNTTTTPHVTSGIFHVVPLTSVSHLLLPSGFSNPVSDPGTTLLGVSALNSRGDLSLSMATRPIPARTVQLITGGQFVEMRDLLGDNAARHFEDMHGFQVLPMASRPRVREVSSLPSWVCCFLTYLAVRTTNPVTRNQLTYATLLVRETM